MTFKKPELRSYFEFLDSIHMAPWLDLRLIRPSDWRVGVSDE